MATSVFAVIQAGCQRLRRWQPVSFCGRSWLHLAGLLSALLVLIPTKTPQPCPSRSEISTWNLPPSTAWSTTSSSHHALFASPARS